jgi:hypothetical protein
MRVERARRSRRRLSAISRLADIARRSHADRQRGCATGNPRAEVKRVESRARLGRWCATRGGTPVGTATGTPFTRACESSRPSRLLGGASREGAPTRSSAAHERTGYASRRGTNRLAPVPRAQSANEMSTNATQSGLMAFVRRWAGGTSAAIGVRDRCRGAASLRGGRRATPALGWCVARAHRLVGARPPPRLRWSGAVG